MIKKSHRGQTTLETALVMIIIVALIGGIVNIWIWSNRQIVERQAAYNKSRVTAGTAIDNYNLTWPVYQPDELPEGQVILR